MMFWIMLLGSIVILMGGYFILHIPLFPLVLMVGLGGCLLAFFTFVKMEKDTEKKIEKLVKKN